MDLQLLISFGIVLFALAGFFVLAQTLWRTWQAKGWMEGFNKANKNSVSLVWNSAGGGKKAHVIGIAWVKRFQVSGVLPFTVQPNADFDKKYFIRFGCKI